MSKVINNSINERGIEKEMTVHIVRPKPDARLIVILMLIMTTVSLLGSVFYSVFISHIDADEISSMLMPYVPLMLLISVLIYAAEWYSYTKDKNKIKSYKL
ncbi:MAG: hypothetical protein HRU38_10765 [Saccharospirillaceae bacterium]|nr:hypothetical protein [Saccharospirillaceae bacterium]